MINPERQKQPTAELGRNFYELKGEWKYTEKNKTK